MAKKNTRTGGVVYSTDPEFNYDQTGERQESTLDPADQHLKISVDKKHRKGKVVTVVDNFAGTAEDLKILGTLLKKHCGVGGSVKDGQILIQGDLRNKIQDLLVKNRYHVTIH